MTEGSSAAGGVAQLKVTCRADACDTPMGLDSFPEKGRRQNFETPRAEDNVPGQQNNVLCCANLQPRRGAQPGQDRIGGGHAAPAIHCRLHKEP